MYRITLFGNFDVTDNTGQSIQFRTRKGKLLLAYLASFPGTHSRDKLARLLYPGQSQAHANLSLRVELSALRRSLKIDKTTLSPLINITRKSVSLNFDIAFVDILEFEWLLAQANRLDEQSRVPLLEQACDLYQGDYLEGCEAPWIHKKREAYQIQFANIISHLCSIYVKDGEYGKLISILNQSTRKLPIKMLDNLREFYDIIQSKTILDHSTQDETSVRYMAKRMPSGLATFAAVYGTPSTGMRLTVTRCMNLEGMLIQKSDRLIIAAFDSPFKAAEWISTEISKNSDLSGALIMDIWSHERKNNLSIISKIQQLVMSLSKGWIVCTEPVAYWLQRDSKYRLQELQFLLSVGIPERLFVLNPQHVSLLSPFCKDSPHILRKQCVPFPYKKLWGRVQELDILYRWYQSAARAPDSRLLTIIGIGGVGKTHLAMEFAYQISCQGADEVVFVPLEGIRTSSELEHAVLSALNEEFPRLLVRLEHALRSRRVLIVLDHAEHLKSEITDQVLSWLEQAPQLKVLITSRSTLDIPVGHQLLLSPLPIPPVETADPDDLKKYASAMLFLDEVQRVCPYFHLTPNNTPQIAALCRLAGGIPLALILLAKQLSIYTPSQLLSTLMTDSTIKTDPLNMAISWTFQRLPSDQQSILCKLSVINGKFNIELANKILNEPLVDEYLSRLLTAGLLVAEHEEDAYWFSIPVPIREFVMKSVNRTEIEGTERNYVFYYVKWIREIISNQSSWKPETIYQLCLHRDHLLASIEGLIRLGEFDVAAEVFILLIPFFEAIGFFESPIRWGEQLLNQSISLQKKPYLLNAIARLYYRIGNGQIAEQMYEHAYHLAIENGCYAAAAESLTGLAGVSLDKLLVHQAEQFCLKVLHEYQDNAPPIIRAEALLRLGYAVRAQMRTDEALHYLEQAMELYRQLGERRYQAIAINALGFLNLIRGNLAVSENLIKESIHLLQEIKDRALLPYALLRWGDLHLEQGRYAEAERIYYEAFDICKNVHLIGGQKAALKRLGELYYICLLYTSDAADE